MAHEFSKRFYNSKQWKLCRNSFIAHRVSIDGGMCQNCRKSLGFIVDHIIELTPVNIYDPCISLGHDNLQYLCLECHNTKTFGKDQSIREGFTFDETGMIIPK